MRFTCPSCSKSYRLGRDRLGNSTGAKIRCPNCKSLVRVRIGEGDKLIAQLADAGMRTSPVARASTAPTAANRPIANRTTPPRSAARDTVAPPEWHVAVGREAQGPLTIAAIQALIDAGKVTDQCLAWKKGLAGWRKIVALPQLAGKLKPRPTPPGSTQRREKVVGNGTGAAIAAASAGSDAGDAPTVMADIPVTIRPNGRAGPTKSAASGAKRRPATMRSKGAQSEGNAATGSATTRAGDTSATRGSGGGDRSKTDRPEAGRGRQAPSTASTQSKRVSSPSTKLDNAALKSTETDARTSGKAPTRKSGERAQTGGQSVDAAAKPGSKREKSQNRAAAGKQESAVHVGRTAKPKDGGGATKAKPVKSGTKRDAAKTALRQPSTKKEAAKRDAATKKVAPAYGASTGGAAQSMAFFESGEQLMADVEFDLPDPNKHKPTKEEYANLLQEFSVMFRLDKRSKRQKAGIVVVLTLLVVGVISFGVILYLQGQQRQALIRDSKTILAVFSLPYQTSETVNLSEEADQEGSEFGEDSTKNARRGNVTSSSLAEQLRKKIRGRRISKARTRQARRPRKAKRLVIKTRSAADLLRGQLAEAGSSVDNNGKTRKVVTMNLRSPPSKRLLLPLCRGAMADLRACARTHAGEAPFRAKVSVSRDGNVVGVRATVDGKSNGALSRCAFAKMKLKRVGALTKSASITCAVN